MWILVMFDLPTNTESERKSASKFRKDLLTLGFNMSQYSVYTRYCVGKQKIDQYLSYVEELIPQKGMVNILLFTDKQYESMKTFRGSVYKKSENKPPDQAMLF